MSPLRSYRPSRSIHTGAARSPTPEPSGSTRTANTCSCASGRPRGGRCAEPPGQAPPHPPSRRDRPQPRPGRRGRVGHQSRVGGPQRYSRARRVGPGGHRGHRERGQARSQRGLPMDPRHGPRNLRRRALRRAHDGDRIQSRFACHRRASRGRARCRRAIQGAQAMAKTAVKPRYTATRHAFIGALKTRAAKVKLAGDASLDDVHKLLDSLDEDEVDNGQLLTGEDIMATEPNIAAPQEKPKTATDADPDAFLAKKLSAEDKKAYDEMCKDRRAKDEAEEEEEKGRGRQARQGRPPRQGRGPRPRRRGGQEKAAEDAGGRATPSAARTPIPTTTTTSPRPWTRRSSPRPSSSRSTPPSGTNAKSPRPRKRFSRSSGSSAATWPSTARATSTSRP